MWWSEWKKNMDKQTALKKKYLSISASNPIHKNLLTSRLPWAKRSSSPRSGQLTWLPGVILTWTIIMSTVPHGWSMSSPCSIWPTNRIGSTRCSVHPACQRKVSVTRCSVQPVCQGKVSVTRCSVQPVCQGKVSVTLLYEWNIDFRCV